jgi:hypothetical protein
MAVPTVNVKGSSYSAYTATGGAAPATGIFYATPALGVGAPPRYGDPQFEEIEHVFPSVQGIGTTRMSAFGPRLIVIDLVFVQATIAAADAAYLSLVNTLAQLARYNVTVRGQSFDGCKLRGASYVGQTSMGGKSILVVSFSWKQMSPGN